MEYVEGANLKVLYARHDPVLLENVAQIIIDMAAALEHVHECGYMHLDFKPENVIVSRNAAVRLVDFDLAQPITEKPRKITKNPGTPAYMAPEQLSGQPIDQRVDVFAFGVAAYELLTNQKPFPAKPPAEILRAQTDRSDFLTPRQLNPDMPVGSGEGDPQVHRARAGQALSVSECAGAGFEGCALRLNGAPVSDPAGWSQTPTISARLSQQVNQSTVLSARRRHQSAGRAGTASGCAWCPLARGPRAR